MTFDVGDTVVYVENPLSVLREEVGFNGARRGLVGRKGVVFYAPPYEDGGIGVHFPGWEMGHDGGMNLGNSGYFVHSSFLELEKPLVLLSYEEML
jgi:hypothetical protein